MSRMEEHLDPRRRAAVDRRLRGRLAHLRPRGYRSSLRGGRHLRLPSLRRGRGGGAGTRGHRRRLAGGAGRTGHLGGKLPSPGGRGAAGGSRGDNQLHERRLLLEPVDVALRRREPMRRVRGVVHGPAAGLTAPQKGGRLAHEATLYQAATLRPFFLTIFAQVPGRWGLGRFSLLARAALQPYLSTTRARNPAPPTGARARGLPIRRSRAATQ